MHVWEICLCQLRFSVGRTVGFLFFLFGGWECLNVSLKANHCTALPSNDSCITQDDCRWVPNMDLNLCGTFVGCSTWRPDLHVPQFALTFPWILCYLSTVAALFRIRSGRSWNTSQSVWFQHDMTQPRTKWTTGRNPRFHHGRWLPRGIHSIFFRSHHFPQFIKLANSSRTTRCVSSLSCPLHRSNPTHISGFRRASVMKELRRTHVWWLAACVVDAVFLL